MSLEFNFYYQMIDCFDSKKWTKIFQTYPILLIEYLNNSVVDQTINIL